MCGRGPADVPGVLGIWGGGHREMGGTWQTPCAKLGFGGDHWRAWSAECHGQRWALRTGLMRRSPLQGR